MKERIKAKSILTTKVIKSSLAMVIPILFIGSFTVLFNGIPIVAYQDFLDTFLGGAPRNIILTVQRGTVGILAIYITIALNLSYMNRTDEGSRLVFRFGSLLASLTGFFILVGLFTGGEVNVALLSGQGVFSAMVAGIMGSWLFKKFESLTRKRKMVFVDGADSEFNAALHVVLPFLGVTLCFAAVNYFIMMVFHVDSVQHLFMKAMDALFVRMHRSYFSGLLYITLISVMWWFGIHGNNVLDQVSTELFTSIIPGEIVSKSFIDTFVNMGGTGCAIGLLCAMLLFGKRNSTKRLSEMALIPGIFNISELMVFGFPIIYNPMMAIPFLLSPILCFSNAFFLTKAGLLPYVTNSVVWTTPPLMSGYMATESFMGVLVQIFNIAISTACYAPFVLLNEKKSYDEFSSSLEALLGVFGKSKEMGEELTLTDYEGNIGRLAKHLANDLEVALVQSTPDTTTEKAENPLLIFYQPQYNRAGKCIGAEALLRWNHMQYGVIAPPLVIEVAKESGDLYDLETYIIERSVYDSFALRRRFGDKFILSINVTVTTLYDKRFIDFLRDLADRYKLRSGNICLEITEDTDLVTTEETADLMGKIRSFGYTFALDDFNMGHTSLQYLQYNQFDIVKLDGSLVGAILDNDRAKEIINSIVYLSQSLDFTIIAEYVETEEQRNALADIGCDLYQGYLYSPAVSRAVLVSGPQSS